MTDAVRCTAEHASWQLALKRLMDIAGSAIGLLLLSPVLLLVALLVKVSSPGPILFRWRVVGQRGKPIMAYKFRTMVEGADRMRAELLDKNEMTGPVFKMSSDPRITPVGRWLRKFSLDELPQLWSVLKGDLSLVGPRPPLQTEYDKFTVWQKQKLLVKPGITCLWQVSGRNRISDFDEWVRLDLEYIQRWSLTLDLKILLKTVPAVLLGTGK